MNRVIKLSVLLSIISSINVMWQTLNQNLQTYSVSFNPQYATLRNSSYHYCLHFVQTIKTSS